jgi:hypothetical protein
MKQREYTKTQSGRKNRFLPLRLGGPLWGEKEPRINSANLRENEIRDARKRPDEQARAGRASRSQQGAEKFDVLPKDKPHLPSQDTFGYRVSCWE